MGDLFGPGVSAFGQAPDPLLCKPAPLQSPSLPADPSLLCSPFSFFVVFSCREIDLKSHKQF